MLPPDAPRGKRRSTADGWLKRVPGSSWALRYLSPDEPEQNENEKDDGCSDHSCRHRAGFSPVQ